MWTFKCIQKYTVRYLGQPGKEGLRGVHEVPVVGVSLVELAARELGIVARIHTLVSIQFVNYLYQWYPKDSDFIGITVHADTGNIDCNLWENLKE